MSMVLLSLFYRGSDCGLREIKYFTQSCTGGGAGVQMQKPNSMRRWDYALEAQAINYGW